MKITKTEKVKMSWDSFTFPITVGTPVSNGGVLADSASAYGLIVRTIFAKPDADETAEIMTGGVIDMEEVSAGYGEELSSAAVQALCGIHFYKNGVCIPSGGSGGGGGVTPEIMAQIQNAQWKTEGDVTLFDESVTTATMGPVSIATLSYAKQLTADTLKVTFNGVEYTCNKLNMGGVVQYGARNTSDGYDFSEYPFSIESTYYDGGVANNALIAETPGTYTVSASAETVTTTETFNSEVQKVAKLNGFVKETSNPSEADFCIVYYSGGDSTEITTVTLGLDGTVKRITSTDQLGEFCAVLWRKSRTTFADENYYFNYGSTNRFSKKYTYLVGDLSNATTDPYIYFVFYPGMNLSLDKLTIKYFCASSDDSGGDSPTTPH